MRSPASSAVLALCLALSLTASAAAQEQVDFNVSRLVRMDDHGGYADIWGYVAPDGREYALLGAKTGTAVINTTDPMNVYETAWFPGVGCTWRDIKTYGTYAYVVNDCAGGVEVIDLSDPENPALVNEFALSFLGHSHNVAIDVGTGMLYAVGTSKGMAVYDLTADPVNPPLVKTWNGQGLSGVTGYVHDLHVTDGVAYLCMINDGLFTLLDVSNLPSTSVLASKDSGEDFTHSTWVETATGIAATADETLGDRNLQLWDVSDPNNPFKLSNVSLGGQTIPHNPYIVGDILHVSYYEEGYLVWDISDPDNPVQIGRHDTSPGSTAPGQFKGNWGAYPFQPSGFVYVSDMTDGFQLLKINAGCAEDPSGRPALCQLWPNEIVMGEPNPSILLTGADFSAATAVNIGGTTLLPGQFTIVDDQVIAVPDPAPLADGLLAVTVENPFGTSPVMYMPVRDPAGPRLSTGSTMHVPIGSTLPINMDSGAAGDDHYLTMSFTPLPSTLGTTASFDIGNEFADLLIFPPLIAGPTGESNLPLFIPASGSGLTVYWQFGVVDAAFTKPVPVSNVAVTIIGP